MNSENTTHEMYAMRNTGGIVRFSCLGMVFFMAGMLLVLYLIFRFPEHSRLIVLLGLLVNMALFSGVMLVAVLGGRRRARFVITPSALQIEDPGAEMNRQFLLSSLSARQANLWFRGRYMGPNPAGPALRLTRSGEQLFTIASRSPKRSWPLTEATIGKADYYTNDEALLALAQALSPPPESHT